jgi:pilus assembly protein CpaB
MVASLVLALVAALSVYRYLEGLGERFPVVVAAAPLPAGKVLAPGDLRVLMLPGDAIHPQALRSLADGLGRVTATEVVAGEQVLQVRVRSREEVGPGCDLAPHLRAMLLPIPVERWGGGVLQRGSRVDVVFVSHDRGQPQLARVLLSGVRVLGVRDERGQAWAGKAAPLGVLVAVTAEEAERLAFALEHGSLYLVLCPFEPEPAATAGVSWENLFLEPARPLAGTGYGGEGVP